MDEDLKEEYGVVEVLNSEDSSGKEVEDKSITANAEKYSKVKDTFKEIEKAEQFAIGIKPNDMVMFAGVMCPVLGVFDDKVKIQVGNDILMLSINEVTRAMSARKKKEVQRKWTSRSQNPLLPPHRE
jgi:hypothetical protein